ncbi:MAG: ABC transporter substrate-binding protein [Propionibacteriaceae bacterium]|jgi:putative ABC transport system substrate-binding protein|nr:ABC transporter substrate-binding protein [Propionibacteriaceae bacterium]
MKLRRLLPALATMAALSLGLSACGTPAEKEDPAATETFNIGVAVIVAHPALEAAQAGFEEVLAEEGVDYKIQFENAQGDPANAPTIATVLAGNADIDLFLAISTPVAVAMASAEQTRPILFTAVTDPVADGLVPSWDAAAPNMTGTSDKNPGALPVHLIQEIMPDVKTIGVLYTSSESNSLSQVEDYKKEAAELGITIKEQGITAASEVSVGLSALADVDAILIPTDNTVVAAIASVIAFGQENKIPVFCADSSTVEAGTVATRGLNYHDLGRRTGEMAVGILRDGKTVADFAPEAPVSTDLSISKAAAESFGITLPDALIAEAKTTF